jgi:hypothetical protein
VTWARMLLGAVITALPLTLAAPAQAQEDEQAQDEPAVQIVLTSIAPAAVTPRDTLAVSARVTNAGKTPLGGVRATLRLNPDVLSSREAVQEWADKGQLGRSRALPGAAEVGTLAPGAGTDVRIVVPANELGLPRERAAFGPRGLGLEVASGGQRLEVARTTIVWYPGKEFTPTRLSLVAPLTAPQGTDVAAPSAGLTETLGDGGTLDRVLAATTDPAIAWAIDPAILAAVRATVEAGDPGATPTDEPGTPGGGSPSPSPSPSTTAEPVDEADLAAAEDWLSRLDAGRSGRDVFALPFADPDAAALVRSGSGALLSAADRMGQTVTQDMLGTPLDATIAWPMGGAADRRTLAAFTKTGRTAVILNGRTQPAATDVGYTTSGRSNVAAGGVTMAGLLYDDALSTLFTATGSRSGAAAGQQLLAELAAITLERPSDRRHVLAVAPRGWDPDPAAVTAAVAALRSAPWVELQGLSALRSSRVEERHVTPRYGKSYGRAELPASHVQAVTGTYLDVLRFSSALVTPEPVRDRLLGRTLSLVSAAWRTDKDGLAAARAPLEREVGSLVQGVHIVRGSSRPFFLASEAALPVYVANGTPYTVQVNVTLQPRSGRLVVERPVTVEIAPGTRRQQVLVPTRAVASGDIAIMASVRTPDGQVLGLDKELVIRVRREWETRGIIGLGSVFGLLLVIGLARGVRRDRSRVRPEDVPDVDDLASAKGDRVAARLEQIEKAAREESRGDQGQSAPRNDVTPSQGGQSVRTLTSPDGTDHGGATVRETDDRTKPVMSRETR